MGKEDTPLQFDMFSGDLVDNRTRAQKQQDKARSQPQQIEMFAQRDIAQFGVNPRPLMPLSPNTRLLLMPEDARTDDEVEQGRQLEAQKRTAQMFAAPISAQASQPENQDAEPPLDTTTLALVPRGIVALVVFGHFAVAGQPDYPQVSSIRAAPARNDDTPTD
jgi:hypothetical protein